MQGVTSILQELQELLRNLAKADALYERYVRALGTAVQIIKTFEKDEKVDLTNQDHVRYVVDKLQDHLAGIVGLNEFMNQPLLAAGLHRALGLAMAIAIDREDTSMIRAVEKFSKAFKAI